MRFGQALKEYKDCTCVQIDKTIPRRHATVILQELAGVEMLQARNTKGHIKLEAGRSAFDVAGPYKLPRSRALK